ncbi:MAG: hypothetical protein JWP10_1485, partial [Nocardioidaceae bacterium]|nr:hypothetical protein [Nocardioidaceae bacterium]
QLSGADPFPSQTTCPIVGFFSTHLTPFVSAKGTTYPSCTESTMAPEAAVGAAFPPAEIAAFTDLHGKGETQFEMRSATENESLGCSDKVACSIVVIPIMGLSCDATSTECTKSGRFEAGSSNFAGDGVDATVSPLYWWSESNWRNRITVPVTFGLAPDACDVLDKRKPVAFYGSELLSQAALQWSPAFCLRKDRFKFQHNRLSDEAAFALMEKKEAAASIVSGERERDTDDPVGYAPTAVSGFAISYIVDEPDNKGERRQLNLTPRLLAKLLTQSYTGSELGSQHPGMSTNPHAINQDPEFKALNPGLDVVSREAGASLLSLSESSDVLTSLTSYIAQDADAAAFVGGTPDPWGMVVNPSYQDITLPRTSWPLLDTFVPTTAQECQKQNPAPYFTQLAAPVTSLRKIAEATLDAWPNVQTKCDRATTSDPYKVGRVDRQGVGSRFMLGLVSLGDAARFGLRTASLQTVSEGKAGEKFSDASGRTFVAPSADTMAAALAFAKPTKPSQAFEISQKDLVTSEEAYPGTMIIYTAALLTGLDKSDAAHVSEFIKVSTTEGQRVGSGNGQLPKGYLPIRKAGATATLYKAAQTVASEIAKQDGLGNQTQPESGSAPADGTVADSAAASGGKVPAAPSTAGPSATGEDVAMTATASATSGLAHTLIPFLLVLGLFAGLGSPLLRIAARRRSR